MDDLIVVAVATKFQPAMPPAAKKTISPAVMSAPATRKPPATINPAATKKIRAASA